MKYFFHTIVNEESLNKYLKGYYATHAFCISKYESKDDDVNKFYDIIKVWCKENFEPEDYYLENTRYGMFIEITLTTYNEESAMAVKLQWN